MKRLADLLVVVGQSGSGKSTLITRLMKEFPTSFGYSISHTTRAPRAGETDGVSYHFVKPEQFMQLVDDGKFIEHAIVHNTMYGTSEVSIKNVTSKNQVCTMDLDIKGAENLRKHPTLKSLIVFVEPPSLDILEARLRGRGTETEDRILTRLTNAKMEIEYFRSHPNFFDGAVVNDDFEECYAAFRELVMTKAYSLPDPHSL